MFWHLSRWPNILSSLRLVATVPLFVLIVENHFRWAWMVLAFAALTDVLDGWLAKRFDWQSAWGAFLDPLADKLMILGVLGALTLIGATPLWLLLVVWGRDAVIACGVLVYYAWLGPFRIIPTALSKASTFIQVLYLLVTLGFVSQDLSLPISWRLAAWLVAFFAIGSGFDYFYRYARAQT
ncbi:MAG: CDP-alcohol phosphatidyltransferase family protein [Gammaproteobacteria bacterium]